MAANDTGSNTSPSGKTDWKKRETLPSALIQIGVVALVLAIAVFFIVRRGTSKKELGELIREARVAAVRGNPADLRKSLEIVERALEKDSGSNEALALAASINTDLWLQHNDAAAEAKAKDLLARAKKADGKKTEEEYGAEAMQLLAAGNAKQAEAFIEDLRKKGANSAKLAYVQALALKAQGNLQLAKAAFTSAIDKAWRDPQYTAAWGEAVLEEGAPGASDAFNKSLGTNPDYFRAKLGQSLSRVLRRDRVGDAATMVKDVQSHDAELSPPLRARALTVQAHIANLEAQSDEAITLATRALALDPKDAWASFAKANALAAKKDPAASAAYAEVVTLQPSAPVFYFEGAKSLLAAGQNDAALALLDRYETFFKSVKNQTAEGKEVAFLDRDDRYWLTRGDVLRELNQAALAMTAYDKAIEAKNLSLTRAYYAKGALLLSQKDYDAAQAVLADITPTDGTGQLPEAYMAMGEVLFAKKEFGPACQAFVYGLIRMKAQQVPREQMNAVVTDIDKRLRSANQGALAKVWQTEAKGFIQ